MIRRLLAIRSRHAAERNVDDEVRFHIEMRTAALLRSGSYTSEEAARAQAVREFGDIAAARRELTAMDQRSATRIARAEWWREIAQDARYALRGFHRQPAFTAVLVATLALGIGSTSAIFTLIDAVRLRPLPVPHAEQLVMLGNNSQTGGIGSSSTVMGTSFTYSVYKELRDRSPYFSGLLASGVTGRLDVLPNGQATELEHPAGRFVSGNYFKVLGVDAALGRTFDGSEDRAVGESPVVVVSHAYWTRRLGADSSMIGRQMMIDRVSFTIIGVAREGFFGEVVGNAPDIWIPITMQPAMMPSDPRLDDHNRYWLQLLGRVKPNVSVADAVAGSLALIRQVLAEQVRLDPSHTRMPERLEVFAGPGATGFSEIRDDFAEPLFTLMVGVGLLLLIACANVGNLLLARAVARTREMSVRIAIGAGRSRLVRQLVTESAVLAIVAGAAALVVAIWGSRLLLALTAGDGAPIPLDLRLDLRVLMFTAGVSFAAVLVFGLAPAYRAARVDVAPILRSQGRGAVGDANRNRYRVPLSKVLIAGQVALSLVLLVGAALLTKSLKSLERKDPGFDRDHLLLVDVDDVARGYTGERHLAFIRLLHERLLALPNVGGVSYSMNGLFSGSDWGTGVEIPGFTARTSADSTVHFDEVGPGYVRAIGAPLIEGRDFTEHDVEGSPPVVIVNQAMARFYFGNVSPLGRFVTFRDTAQAPLRAEVVGVMGDVRTGESGTRNGARSLTRPPLRRFYVPYQQHPGDVPPLEARFEVRTNGNPASLIASVRHAVASIDPMVPINDIYPLPSRIRDSMAQQRLLAALSTGFGTLALMLAAIGLYGVMTHAVSRRTGELGLRMALGAERGDIIALVLREALHLVGAGLVVGVPGGFVAVRLLRAQLPGASTVDVPSIALALGVLVATAVVATLVPAIRAGRVAPIVALSGSES
jgi:predicted permease